MRNSHAAELPLSARELLREALTPERTLAMAMSAMAQRAYFAALCLADRRCRTARPDAQLLVLRAEASYHCGHTRFALDDLIEALEVDPDNLNAHRRLLTWGTDELRIKAAQALVRLSDPESLTDSLNALREHGAQAAASLQSRGGELRGW